EAAEGFLWHGSRSTARRSRLVPIEDPIIAVFICFESIDVELRALPTIPTSFPDPINNHAESHAASIFDFSLFAPSTNETSGAQSVKANDRDPTIRHGRRS